MEHGADSDLEPGFLHELTGQSLLGALAVLDTAAGQLPAKHIGDVLGRDEHLAIAHQHAIDPEIFGVIEICHGAILDEFAEGSIANLSDCVRLRKNP